MAAINPESIDNDVRRVLEHLFQEETLNPSNPIASSYRPYFDFKWGERVTSCEKSRPIVAAFPDGQRGVSEDFQTKQLDYFFRLQVISAGDDRTNENLFYQIASQIKSAFGSTSINHKYTNPFEYTDPSGIDRNIHAPFKLGALGIFSSDVISASQPRRLPGEHFRPMSLEILVRWRFYLSVC